MLKKPNLTYLNVELAVAVGVQNCADVTIDDMRWYSVYMYNVKQYTEDGLT